MAGLTSVYGCTVASFLEGTPLRTSDPKPVPPVWRRVVAFTVVTRLRSPSLVALVCCEAVVEAVTRQSVVCCGNPWLFSHAALPW